MGAVFLCAFLVPTTLFADTIDGKKYPESVCRAARTEGGFWFDDAGAKYCLQLKEDAETYLARMAILRSQKESFKREVDLFKKNETHSKEQIVLWKTQADVSTKRVAHLERDLAHWYRNPWITVPAGLVIGAAGAALAIWRLP